MYDARRQRPGDYSQRALAKKDERSRVRSFVFDSAPSIG
jgi:hypothetical protein